MPTKEEIVAYWSKHDAGRGWLADVQPEEDMCFCCGRQPCSTQKHHITPLATEHGAELAGMSGRERRRHLLALEALNGPERFHLLCRRCHKLAPHTNNAEVYWRWFENQPTYIQQVIAATEEGYRQAGATEAEKKRLLEEKRYLAFSQTAKSLNFCHPENDLITVVSSTVCKLILDMRRDHQNKPRTLWLPGMEPRCK